MPMITAKLAKGRGAEQKQVFIEAITNGNEERVTFLFDGYERDNWASSGQLHPIKFGEAFGKKGTE